MVEEVAKATKERAQHLSGLDFESTVNKLSLVIAHIDTSRIARNCGDLGSAEASLDCARNILLVLLGLKEEETT